ncbi:helix-turn-helix domain-containing protein [Pseudonocardia sp. KRD-184]|uniref:Helix-turn-helix domain-containing protein n=1 Tax=Pseudonocardia oceani TaxID=2792013 RepID=A0ABS6UEB3_9PSEU|nr:PucR family transcriptional regulator [Pseudonocardia oceani]MBW0089144.1 helix-turn-helix domain-containing protein [Pseudonocardia oceani]MBW0095966.1 helix-turn-helix domain-containing protein [Pseudonocardia oceani]MBW0108854.1 helix-turn-helix domain-containing protein [Pseudonocardia oceani]MBW0120197.1 helix-turn-helix domain-containing protein [Pseudonocardia oceani]MBW0130241.1 helix-turn-helix domain-containing protein [Pseudonocardia oceani]
MAPLHEVLRTPGLALDLLGGGTTDTEVWSVVLVEDLANIGQAPEASIVVLGVHANAALDTYRFDVALRVAAGRGVAAIVLADPDAPQPTTTSVAAAQRYGVTLLRNTVAGNVAVLVCGLDVALRGPAELALRRAMVTLQRIAGRRDDTPDELVADVARLADTRIELADRPDGELAFPVGLDEDVAQWVNVRADGASRPELALIGQLLADALGISHLAERRARDLPVRSRAELLAELLDSSARGRSELLRRARSLGLPIDGWHVVARIEQDDDMPPAADEVAAFAAREELVRILLESVRSSGTWHFARAERGLLLIQMSRSDPGATAAVDATRTVQRAIDDAAAAFPKLEVFCGIGSVQSGPTGMINSAAEARAAAGAMRARARPNTATAFDGLGLRRTLVEWYASHTARSAVDAVLAPLDRMGQAKADAAIRTLQAYLDNHGSLSRAASELHLHRNSVAYRVDRIFAELDVDQNNPDDWLLLQLACRARSLT